MIQAFYCMNNNIGSKKLQLNFMSQPFSFSVGKNNFQVIRYDLDHRVPTYAYGIHIIKRQLKEIYMGKSGKEIGELRKQLIYMKILIYHFFFIAVTQVNQL